MKLCDVTQFYSPVSGGVKRYISEKQRYIARRGIDEHLLIIPGKKTECISEERCRIYTIRSPRIDRTSRYRILLNLNVVRRILREEIPDLIESGDPYHVAWTVLDEADRLGIPTTGFYHSHFPDAYLRTIDKYLGKTARDFVLDYAQDYIRRLYTKFNRTLVPSPHLKEVLQRWGVYNGVTVKLGVDIEQFRPSARNEEIRQQLNVKPDQILLLSVGRLAAEKNTQVLLQAFEQLCESRPGRFYLWIIGDGPLRNHVLETARRTGCVKWDSYFQDSNILAKVYHAADLFVHPGLYETFGLVTVEAQACGLPVVGFRGSFMDRLIFAGLDLWAEQRTADSLALAISRMSQQSLREMGVQAAEVVRKDYSWEKVFGELFEIYRIICQEKKV